MNNEIKEEKALLYALGTLPEAEVEEFEALVRSDHEMQALVHELQTLNELEVAECESVEPPFQLYSKIMAQIEMSKGSSADVVAFEEEELPAETQKKKIVPFLAWSGWAAAACAAVLFASNLFEPTQIVAETKPKAPESDIILNNLANPILAAVRTPSEDFGIEDRMLELASLAEAYWFSREGIPSDQLLAGNDSTDVEELSGGFTIFDRKYQIGFIAVENLPKKAEGKSYHVWAKTGKGNATVNAGSLPIGDESRGLFFFDLSSVPEVASLDRINFFVTEERTDSPDSPTGMVVLSNYLR